MAGGTWGTISSSQKGLYTLMQWASRVIRSWNSKLKGCQVLQKQRLILYCLYLEVIRSSLEIFYPWCQKSKALQGRKRTRDISLANKSSVRDTPEDSSEVQICTQSYLPRKHKHPLCLAACCCLPWKSIVHRAVLQYIYYFLFFFSLFSSSSSFFKKRKKSWHSGMWSFFK